MNIQVPVSPFDNALAVDQMEVAYSTLLKRPTTSGSRAIALDGKEHPRIVRFCAVLLLVWIGAHSFKA